MNRFPDMPGFYSRNTLNSLQFLSRFDIPEMRSLVVMAVLVIPLE